MASTVVGHAEWLAEITDQARNKQSKVFSVSVPVNHPEIASDAHEQLLSEAIEGIELQGWKLESKRTEPKHDRCHLRHFLNCGFSRAKHSGCHRYSALLVTSSVRGRPVSPPLRPAAALSRAPSLLPVRGTAFMRQKA